MLEPVEIIQLFYVQGTRIRAVSITETKPSGPNETVGPQRKLFDLVQSGKLKVLIDKAYPLEEAKEAVRVIEDRAVFGKVVVTP